MSAFRATDAFAVEAYRACRAIPNAAGDGLAREIRRTVVRSGGALVEASTHPRGGREERACLERTRTALVESRYYLYLARRFGLLDFKSYRALTVRQDAALRELTALLGKPSVQEDGDAEAGQRPRGAVP